MRVLLAILLLSLIGSSVAAQLELDQYIDVREYEWGRRIYIYKEKPTLYDLMIQELIKDIFRDDYYDRRLYDWEEECDE